MNRLARFRPDEFTLAMAITVTIAFVLPCHGAGARVFAGLTSVAIGLLFFLQGARLSRAAIVAGASHWRLHLVVFSATFLVFPLAGLALRPLVSGLLTPPIVVGLLFLCTLPSTVQASVAFTSIASGNVAAAVCSASASSLIGMAATPLLAGLLLQSHGGFSLDALRSIAFELLAPFVAGQVLRGRIGDFVRRHGKVLGLVDRGSILLMVYTVFSAATVAGIWHLLMPQAFAVLAAVDGVLLALMLATTAIIARCLGFSRRDEIAIVFCGSKKSLVSGITMANVLFAGPTLGLVVLPLMIFHQLQLMACAALARRYAIAAVTVLPNPSAADALAPEAHAGQPASRARADFSLGGSARRAGLPQHLRQVRMKAPGTSELSAP